MELGIVGILLLITYIILPDISFSMNNLLFIFRLIIATVVIVMTISSFRKKVLGIEAGYVLVALEIVICIGTFILSLMSKHSVGGISIIDMIIIIFLLQDLNAMKKIIYKD